MTINNLYPLLLLFTYEDSEISLSSFRSANIEWHKRWNLANGSTAILSPKFKQLLNVRTLCIRIISTERDCIALRHYTHWGSSHKAGFSSFCVDHISWITDGCMPVRVSFTCETLLSVHLQSLGGGQGLIPNNQNRFVLLSGNAV